MARDETGGHETPSPAGRGSEQEFVEFATARAKALRDIAYLMCGDWHEAQDLTQQTLAKTYVAWPRIQRESVDAYARTVLVREFLSERRRRRSTERPVAFIPDSPSPAEEPEVRLTLLAALDRLPANRRVVLVLRYWNDLSVETVAETMRLTPAAVKSLTHRALEDLRSVLGPVLPHEAA